MAKGTPATVQLEKAGVLNADDRGLLAALAVQFYPVGADSPKDALVFTRRTPQMEHRYYKGYPDDAVIWWNSPDNRFAVVNSPESPSSKARIVTVTERATDKVMLEYKTDAYNVFASWRQDSRLAAVEETRQGGKSEGAFLSITPKGVKRIAFPVELAAHQLLTEEDRQQNLKLNS